jgi:ribulose-5-phosphate 4-epimerase/fuculose-1-phosphate aldolase
MGEIISARGHTLLHKNGGYVKDLGDVISGTPRCDVILWFPNVPNEFPKFRNMKDFFPHATLVTSKRNVEGKYTFADMVNRALGTKSSFMVEYTKDCNGVYNGRLFDALGCVWVDSTPNFIKVITRLFERIEFIRSLTREGSTCTGIGKEVPDQPEFFAIVKHLGDLFHKLVHPAEGVKRFLGNASFRCERGFPAFRDSDDRTFVSRRNVDKRFINRDAFVEVALGDRTVLYKGDNKPSVDAPIMLRLFSQFPKVNYIIHSHVYIKNAPFTAHALPCGSVEEFDEIVRAHKRVHVVTHDFSINLLGHGSIVLAKDVQHLKNIIYYARPAPEVINDSPERQIQSCANHD